MRLCPLCSALVLTSWFNSALFTVEGLQIYSYFSRFRNDTMLNKTFVSIALVSDIMGVIASLASVYLYAVTHFGDAVFAQTQPWTFPGEYNTLLCPPEHDSLLTYSSLSDPNSICDGEHRALFYDFRTA